MRMRLIMKSCDKVASWWGSAATKDVATIELGTRAYDYINEVNGHPGCNIMIAQTSGSNANEIIEEIDRTVDEISKRCQRV